jgi:predicted NBD/HSP70 family sugar kinase
VVSGGTFWWGGERVIDPIPSVRDRHDLVRKINQQRIMKIVSEKNPIGIPQLIKASGLSRPTVDLIISLFLENGLIRESGFTHGRPGRKAALYELDPNTGFGVGVDLGGSKIACAIADIGGKILADIYEPINPKGGSSIIAQIIEMINNVAQKANISPDKIKQISIGTPGVISKDGQLSLGANVQNLDGMHLQSILRKLFDVEVGVENDLNLAAVGEFLHGSAKEILNFALIQLGTGIGAGIFVDGQLVRGARGAAGEVAFLPLFGDLTDPWAVENGLIESVVGTKGITKRYQELTKSNKQVTVKEIFELASKGQPDALTVVQEVGKYLGYLCASLKAIVDPELIIIGGGIGSNQMLLPIIQQWANKLVPFEVKIITTNLDVKAGVIGAAAYAAEKIRTRMMVETTERDR